MVVVGLVLAFALDLTGTAAFCDRHELIPEGSRMPSMASEVAESSSARQVFRFSDTSHQVNGQCLLVIPAKAGMTKIRFSFGKVTMYN